MNRASRTDATFLAFAAAALLATVGAGCQVSKTQDQPRDQPPDWFQGGPMQAASPETLQLTARVLAAKGRTDQAGFLIERMLATYPDNIGTYSEGAEVLLVEGRVAEAIKWLDRGLERMPNQPILVNDRGLCHLLNANLPAATKDFQTAYDADPADADYVGNLALAKALAGDEAGARALWGRIIPATDVELNVQAARDARPKFKSAKIVKETQ